jgi:hypothetical protein
MQKAAEILVMEFLVSAKHWHSLTGKVSFLAFVTFWSGGMPVLLVSLWVMSFLPNSPAP